MARLRNILFDAGAAMVSRLFPDRIDLYACPLCLRLFPRNALHDGALTLEHAPPRRLGGRCVALTCRDCNSRGGHLVDADMQAQENLIGFFRGQTLGPLRARLVMAGSTLNVEASAVGNGIRLVALRERYQNPADRAAVLAEFDRLATEGGFEGYKFNLTFPSVYRHRPALVGWLRAAYILAFAALGYRYILRPELATVRQQLSSPRDEVIPCFSLTLPSASVDERTMMFIYEPADHRSLAVQIGRHMVLLPYPGDADLYHRLGLKASTQSEANIQIRSKIVPWPHSLVLAADIS